MFLETHRQHKPATHRRLYATYSIPWSLLNTCYSHCAITELRSWSLDIWVVFFVFESLIPSLNKHCRAFTCVHQALFYMPWAGEAQWVPDFRKSIVWEIKYTGMTCLTSTLKLQSSRNWSYKKQPTIKSIPSWPLCFWSSPHNKPGYTRKIETSETGWCLKTGASCRLQWLHQRLVHLGLLGRVTSGKQVNVVVENSVPISFFPPVSRWAKYSQVKLW